MSVLGVRTHMCGTRHHFAAGDRRAYTLVELVIGATITAVMMLAVGSTVHVMTRGAGSVEKSSRLAADARVAMTRLRREIGAAVTVSQLTSTHICFTHPDVDGDGADDAITYDWSGSGASLMRTVDDGTSMSVVDGVDQFSLVRYTDQLTFPGSTTDLTEEQLLASHDSCSMPYPCSFDGRGLSSQWWRGERFAPSYSGAVSFGVTRVKLYLQGASSTGNILVSVRSSDCRTSYEEVSVPLSTLSTSEYLWYEFPFSSVGGVSIGHSISIVARVTTASAGAYTGRDHYTLYVPANGLTYLYTTNGGSSWSDEQGYDLRFFAYGRFKVSQPREGTPITRTYLNHFDIRLRVVEGSNTATLDSGAMCLNRPEITGLN